MEGNVTVTPARLFSMLDLDELFVPVHPENAVNVQKHKSVAVMNIFIFRELKVDNGCLKILFIIIILYY
jgi:hypothetical protein